MRAGRLRRLHARLLRARVSSPVTCTNKWYLQIGTEGGGGSYLDNGKVTINALARETTSRFFHRLTKSLLLSLSPENTYNNISCFIASIYLS